MAFTYLIDLNHNDDLKKVIQKCNRNFKLVVGQISKQAKESKIENQTDIDEALSQIVIDLSGDIASEAAARRNADQDLQGQIDTLSGILSGLATVAYTGDYNDLINVPAQVTVHQNSDNSLSIG